MGRGGGGAAERAGLEEAGSEWGWEAGPRAGPVRGRSREGRGRSEVENSGPRPRLPVVPRPARSAGGSCELKF